MRDPSRAPVDVVIENLSETGALLTSDGSLPVGTLVSLGIAGAGLHLARVVRTQPAAMAIEFMLPLDPAAVARARSAETLVSVAFPQMPSEPARIVRQPPSDMPERIDAVPGAPDAEWRSLAAWLIGAAIVATLLVLSIV